MALVSCKTTKNILIKNEPSDSLITLIKKVQQAEPVFKNANVSKMGLEITYNTHTFNVSASCKIINDSAIHVSIQPVLGIELFKAEISTDSIMLFDKMNRRLYALDYTNISRLTGININYFNLQALIANRLFCAGETQVTPAACTFVAKPDGKSEIIFNTEKFKQTSLISDQNTIDQVLVKGSGSKFELTTEYSDYQLIDSLRFPRKINIAAITQRNKLICDFNISKLNFNTDFALTNSEKTKFTRTNINQLLNK